jgi:glutaredoxin
MTQRTLNHLNEIGVPYEYINVDEDRRASDWVRRHNDGKEKKPTVDIGGEILSEPSNDELDAALRRKDIAA